MEDHASQAASGVTCIKCGRSTPHSYMLHAATRKEVKYRILRDEAIVYYNPFRSYAAGVCEDCVRTSERRESLAYAVMCGLVGLGILLGSLAGALFLEGEGQELSWVGVFISALPLLGTGVIWRSLKSQSRKTIVTLTVVCRAYPAANG